MSEKSFEERRAALRERVQEQIEAKEGDSLPDLPDLANNTEEREIVVKPMIDLDYDERERLRMIVAILVLIGSILGIVSGGILLQGNPDELLNSSLFNEAETVDITGQVLTIDGVTLENATIELYEDKRPNLIKGGKEINASGMFVLPGFIDMHAHIGGISQGADWDYVFNLWLAHGVTTVREVGGRGRDWTLDLKKKSEKNLIIAPRIIQHTSFGQGSKNKISTPEQARQWVRNNAKAGSDGIKFFGAAPEIMKAALEENPAPPLPRSSESLISFMIKSFPLLIIFFVKYLFLYWLHVSFLSGAFDIIFKILF